jgi:hypothetical protein
MPSGDEYLILNPQAEFAAQRKARVRRSLVMLFIGVVDV